MIYQDTIDGRELVLQPSSYTMEYVVTLGDLIVATISQEIGPSSRWQYRVREWSPDQVGDYGDMVLYTLDEVWRRIRLYAKYEFAPNIK